MIDENEDEDESSLRVVRESVVVVERGDVKEKWARKNEIAKKSAEIETCNFYLITLIALCLSTRFPGSFPPSSDRVRPSQVLSRFFVIFGVVQCSDRTDAKTGGTRGGLKFGVTPPYPHFPCFQTGYDGNTCLLTPVNQKMYR